jgi:hypothetical protein
MLFGTQPFKAIKKNYSAAEYWFYTFLITRIREIKKLITAIFFNLGEIGSVPNEFIIANPKQYEVD